MKFHTNILLVLTAVISQAAAANTLHVCSTCAHTTIQTAVNDAVSGDTISIAAGHYNENITIIGKQLILQGAVGGTAGVTEVSGGARGPVFTLGSAVTGDAPQLIEIDNLIISSGNHTSGTGQGGGVQVRAGAYLHLNNSTVTQNFANSGAGVSVNTPGAPATVINGCVIDGNQTPEARSEDAEGGGVGVFGTSKVTIQASTIAHNLANDGGGLYADPGTVVTIVGSTFSENTAQSFEAGHFGPSGGGGGGVESYGSFSITNSSFVDNAATGPNGGGGLFLVLAAADSHVISNIIVARNTTSYDGNPQDTEGVGSGIGAYGESDATRSSLTITGSFVVQNLAAGGIWYDSNSMSLTLNNTVVLGNTGGQICNNVSACTP